MKWKVVGAFAVFGIVSLRVFSSSGEAPRNYRQVSVRRGPIAVAITATGVVQPQNRVSVKPPIAGRVEEVLVKEGQAVKRGEILAWMSSNERAALIDAARAKGAAEVKEWQELYRATPILAPIDGSIIQRNVQPGQSFTPSDPVFMISDRLTVKTLIDETDVAQVHPGQQATIVLDAYAESKLAGRVNHVAFDGKTINSITTYETDVVPMNAPAFMRSGMTADVTFEIAKKQNVLLLPAEAVRTGGGARPRVLLPPSGSGQPPVTREIGIGVSDGKEIEVVNGLAENDTVLIPEIRHEDGKKGGLLAPAR